MLDRHEYPWLKESRAAKSILEIKGCWYVKDLEVFTNGWLRLALCLVDWYEIEGQLKFSKMF